MKNEPKTTSEYVISGAAYFIPSGVAGASLTTLLAYYFNMPTEVAMAFTVLFAWLFNTALIFYKKHAT